MTDLGSSWRGWVVLAIAIVGCGDDAPVDVDSGSSGGPTDTGSSGGSLDASASATESSGDAGSSGSSGASTTESSGADTSTGESTAADTTATVGSDSSSGTESTGGGVCEPLADPGDWPCGDDDDCAIAGDCCSCVAYNPNMGSPGNCGGGCGMDVCEQLGLDTAVCTDGFCEVAGFSCDQTTVSCDGLPPDCDDGWLPQVEDGCWTGECLPVEWCDWVPDCDACPDDQECVIVQADDCDHFDCVAPIEECGFGPPTCDCFGAVVCEPPYAACEIDDDGAVVCS
jgi:hypothetical protein